MDKKNLRKLKAAARKGNADAQFELGEAYYVGIGVLKDDKEAVHWLRMGADQGDADAQFMLGGMYSAGHGVTMDQDEAVKLCQRAAEGGNSHAQYNMGMTYYLGRCNVNRDFKEAARLLRLAAAQGHEDAKEAMEGAFLRNS